MNPRTRLVTITGPTTHRTAVAASSSGPAAFLARAGFACLLLIALIVPAQGQSNTFTGTRPLLTARSAHTATLLPNGKVLVAGGATGGSSTNSAELFDPATGRWTATGALTTARSGHTATPLANGKVLVAGGTNGSFVASAELYDPATGAWTGAGSVTPARAGHTATLLPNGRVLIAGGETAGEVSLASAALYDPATGAWSTTGNLAAARRYHTATLLPNGRVLVAAGMGDITELVSTELYDPVSGAWTATGSLGTRRLRHTATLLPNGKVLVAGGSYFDYTDFTTRYAAAELYDPAGGTWSATVSPAFGRSNHTAALLPNGKVLIAGGLTADFNSLVSAELYQPDGTWATTGPLSAARHAHTTTLLASGDVLVAGGYNGTSLSSVELFGSAAGSWVPTLTSPGAARNDHSATLLPNGKVLVAGGNHVGSLTSTELYDPASGAWTPANGSLSTGRFNHTATLLADGRVLVVGGFNIPMGRLASAELFDPATGTWSSAGSLVTGRYGHTATLLADGKVLVAGGAITPGNFIASVELFDPLSGNWSAAPGNLATARYRHTATLLANGKVLVAGGEIAGGSYFVASEIYDPASGAWTSAPRLDAGRSHHTATLLPDGKVLVAGGSGDSGVQIAEIFDPALGFWLPSGPLATPRYNHTATLLSNGKVMLAGGSTLFPVESPSAELFDPATGLWTLTGSLSAARTLSTATLLPKGTVLVTGGARSSGGNVTSAELYDAGVGVSGGLQPQISSAAFDGSGRLVLTGTGFRGISSASGGNGSQDSPAHHPVVQLRRLDNEQSAFLLPDSATAVSATTFTSVPVAPFSGYAMVTVFTGGIPGASFITAFPNIVIQQPAGTTIADGGTLNFVAALGNPASLVFTVRNTGGANLTGLTISRDGINAADLTVTASPAAPLPAGGSTTFTIRFSPSTSGVKSAALHIANNVPGRNPYDINLSAHALSFTVDTDGDGLNDASEFQMAALGFNWQVSQPALVSALTSNLNDAGYYTAAQIQSLNVGARFLERNPATGQFKLEIGMEKSTNLTTFTPFPFLAPQTTVRPDGRIEFLFAVPDNAAFFKLQPQ